MKTVHPILYEGTGVGRGILYVGEACFFLGVGHAFFALSLSSSETQHPLKATDREGNHRNTLSTVSAITSASFFAAPESTKDGSVVPDGFDIGTGFKNNSHFLDWHAASIISTAFLINGASTFQATFWIIAATSPEPERVTDVPPHPDTNTPRIISPMTRFFISDPFSNADNGREKFPLIRPDLGSYPMPCAGCCIQ